MANGNVTIESPGSCTTCGHKQSNLKLASDMENSQEDQRDESKAKP